MESEEKNWYEVQLKDNRSVWCWLTTSEAETNIFEEGFLDTVICREKTGMNPPSPPSESPTPSEPPDSVMTSSPTDTVKITAAPANSLKTSATVVRSVAPGTLLGPVPAGTVIPPGSIKLSVLPVWPKKDAGPTIQFKSFAADDAEWSNRKGWTPSKTKSLIQMCKDNKPRFHEFTKKKVVWEMIADILNKAGGIQFTGEETHKKWRNLKDRYKRITKANLKKGYNRSNWIFYQDMHELLRDDSEVQSDIARSVREAREAEQPIRIIDTASQSQFELSQVSNGTKKSQLELSQTSLGEPKSDLNCTPRNEPKSTIAISSLSLAGSSIFKDEVESVKSPSEHSKKFEGDDEAPAWFSTAMMEMDKKCSKRQKKMRKLMKKFMKIEKKRNKILEQILSKHCQ